MMSECKPCDAKLHEEHRLDKLLQSNAFMLRPACGISRIHVASLKIHRTSPMYFRTVNLPTWNSHERSNDQAKSNNSTSSASSQSVVHGWSVLGRGILHVDQARLAHLHDSGAEAAATNNHHRNRNRGKNLSSTSFAWVTTANNLCQGTHGEGMSGQSWLYKASADMRQQKGSSGGANATDRNEEGRLSSLVTSHGCIRVNPFTGW